MISKYLNQRLSIKDRKVQIFFLSFLVLFLPLLISQVGKPTNLQTKAAPTAYLSLVPDNMAKNMDGKWILPLNQEVKINLVLTAYSDQVEGVFTEIRYDPQVLTIDLVNDPSNPQSNLACETPDNKYLNHTVAKDIDMDNSGNQTGTVSLFCNAGQITVPFEPDIKGFFPANTSAPIAQITFTTLKEIENSSLSFVIKTTSINKLPCLSAGKACENILNPSSTQNLTFDVKAFNNMSLSLETSLDTYIFQPFDYAPAEDKQAFSNSKLKASSSWPRYMPLLYFDLSQIPKEAEILEAKLALEVVEWDGIAASSSNLNLARLSKPFDKNASWENDSSMPPTKSFMANFEKNEIDIANWVQKWVNGEVENYGLIISTNRNQKAAYRAFASSENPDQAKQPILNMTYRLIGQQEPTPTPLQTPQTLKLDNPFDTYIFRQSNLSEDARAFNSSRLKASSSWPMYKPLLRFDLQQIPQEGAKILSAKLTLEVIEWDGITATSSNLNLARLSKPFDANAVWDNFAYLDPLKHFTANFEKNEIDITDWVQEWIDGKVKNYGLVISTNRNQRAEYRAFASSKHPRQEQRSLLEVIYQ